MPIFGDCRRMQAQALSTLRYVDHRGKADRNLSAQPQRFAAGHHRPDHADGRFTIMMPHPERVFRAVQMSWHPDGLAASESPWLRMFRNARRAVG